MGIRIASLLTFGIVAIGMVALFVWLDNRNTPPVSAQETVQRVCGDMDNIDSYDFIASVKAEQDGVVFPDTMTFKASVSGKDYQMSYTVGSDNSSEFIKVGDMGYTRSSVDGNIWEVSKSDLQDIAPQLSALGDSPVCPEITNVLWKGEEELDGVKVTVYTSGDTSGVEKTALNDVDGSFQGLKHASNHEYWVDGNGLLVQHREERHTLSQHDGNRTVLHFFTLATFSGVGEPNTITAPTIP